MVTDTGLCGPRGVPATVQAAVAGGVTVVQLRDPGATDAHFVALGVAVREVLAGTGVLSSPGFGRGFFSWFPMRPRL
nr:thiamine phosphate synthase [Brevibacterium sp. R8603A2]